MALLDLQTPVQYVKGIGPKLAEVLATKGITTVEDLLYYLPFRYEDRLNPRRISELPAGEMASVIGEVRTSGLFRTRRGPIFELTVGDPVMPSAIDHRPSAQPGMFGAVRSTLKCIWFHGSYLQDRFQPGQLIALYGKVEESKKGRATLELINPQFEILHGETPDSAADSLEIGRIVPVYGSMADGKVTSRFFRRVIYGALDN